MEKLKNRPEEVKASEKISSRRTAFTCLEEIYGFVGMPHSLRRLKRNYKGRGYMQLLAEAKAMSEAKDELSALVAKWFEVVKSKKLI